MRKAFFPVILVLFAVLFLVFTRTPTKAALVPTQQLLAQTSALPYGESSAGGESIGGGDNEDVRKHTAWFYGNKEIQVCYHVSQPFGLDSTKVGESIKEVVSQWQKYFTSKKIGAQLPAENRINTNFKIKSECVGEEDLVLYFGTGPIFGNLGDVRARQALSRPVAYVNKTHISEDYRWGKGYVRFVEPQLYSLEKGHFPVWSKGVSFYNLLLHEWGHILGFSHSPKTIMRKEISKELFVDGELYKKKMSIDDEAELYPCRECKSEYQVVNSQINGLEGLEINKDVIKMSGLSANVEIQHSNYDQPPMNLLSMFSYKDYRFKVPKFFMLKIDGKNYVLEIKGRKALLLREKNVVAEFARKEF